MILPPQFTNLSVRVINTDSEIQVLKGGSELGTAEPVDMVAESAEEGLDRETEHQTPN